MSERAGAAAVFGLVASLATGAGPLSAQQAGPPPPRMPTIAEQRARSAAFDRLARTAKATVDSLDRVRNAQARYDTIRVGALTLLAWPDDAPVVRAGAELAWQGLSPALRGDAALLNREWIFLRVGSASAARSLVSSHAVRSATVRGTAPDATAVGDQIVTMIAQSLADAGSRQLHDWLGGAVPLADQTQWLAEEYRELVTAPSQASRRCFTGELAACRVALALDTLSDAATAWYGPGEREAVVRQFESHNGWMVNNDPARRGMVSRCLDIHDDSNCTAFLRTLSRGNLHPPLSVAARSGVARAALAVAPPGGYTRFVSTLGTPGARLAAAAGIPLDSIVAAWRTKVLAAQPPSPKVGLGTQWSTLFWVVVFGALSLRSSRWRSA